MTAQVNRVYNLSVSYGLAHHLLSPILNAALAAGHEAVACQTLWNRNGRPI